MPGYWLDSDFPNASFLDVVGRQFDGTEVITRLAMDGLVDGKFGVDDFQTFTLDGRFSNLLSVRFQGWASDGREGGVALDNIGVGPGTSSVPEPGTLSIMAMGLLGAGIARRRKTAVTKPR